jgi:uncharacterized Zn finger protein
MQCVRCGGMKVPEIIVEGGARFFAVHCVHCGDVIDPIIINRRRRRYGRTGRQRTRSMTVNRCA